MPKRWISIVLPTLALLAGPVAQAKDKEEGMLVSVAVVDEQGRPIPNAWVRVPDTEGRRLVDPETGVWATRYLYAYDGMEIFFERGMVLELTISAPGYSSRLARYRVRGGKNQLTVELSKLPEEEADADTQITWFRKSLPPDQVGPEVGSGTPPAPPEEQEEDEEPDAPPPEDDDSDANE